MTTNEPTALASLLALRTGTREQAERSWVKALRAHDAARAALERGRQAVDAYRARSNQALDEARSSARTGADFVAVDTLARTIRDESRRLTAEVDALSKAAQAAAGQSEAARAALARAQAGEKAVEQRLEAAAAVARSATISAADDEADELAAGRR